MTNNQAVKLFKQRKKIKAEYRAARDVFEPFHKRMQLMRHVTEIYKGKAIRFQDWNGMLQADGIGNKRTIKGYYDKIIAHGWQLQVWPSQGKSYITTFSGTKAEVIVKMKDFVITGKLVTQLRAPRRKK